MARKSRKQKISLETNTWKKEEAREAIPTGIYVRLSMENNGYDTEDSIGTQIRLVEEYIENRGDMEVVDFFVDNGCTGTNFERPEFQRMMEEIKEGHIRCVVVKDLSRFGRNYVETGYYMEYIFPLWDVRLIAVTDQFDSARKEDRESLMVPIKNLVNAMFAKDASRKQVAVRSMKRRLGVCTLALPPYGYERIREENRLVIHPELALYVRMIFSWTIAGVKRRAIAKRLNLLEVPTPLSVLHAQGKMVTKKDSGWTEEKVREILKNPSYTGEMVMGKTRQALYRGIARTKQSRENWIIIPQSHEGIISKGEYQYVEKGFLENREKLRKRKERVEGREDCFQGMIYCGNCGRRLSPEWIRHGEQKEEMRAVYYRCPSQKDKCVMGQRRISQNLLKIMVMDRVTEWMNCAQAMNLKKSIKKVEESRKKYEENKKIIAELEGRKQWLKDRQAALYAEYAGEMLERVEYQWKKEELKSELEETEKEEERWKEENEKRRQEMVLWNEKIDEIRLFLKERKFCSELMREWIHSVMIYEGNRIEVKFNFMDNITLATKEEDNDSHLS